MDKSGNEVDGGGHNERVDPKKPNANGKKLTGGKSGGSSTKKPTPPKPTPPKKLTNVKVECPKQSLWD